MGGWDGESIVGKKMTLASFLLSLISHVNISQKVHRLQILSTHTCVCVHTHTCVCMHACTNTHTHETTIKQSKYGKNCEKRNSVDSMKIVFLNLILSPNRYNLCYSSLGNIILYQFVPKITIILSRIAVISCMLFSRKENIKNRMKICMIQYQSYCKEV